MMIKEFRKQLGISQSRMAEHLNISRSHFAMIETGRRDLRNKDFIELQDLLSAINAIPETEAGKGQMAKGDAMFKKLLGEEITIYKHKLGKINRGLDRLTKIQERSLKLIERMDSMLAIAKEKEKKLLSVIDDDAKEIQESNIKTLLRLNMQKCSCEAILRYLEKENEKIR